MKHMRYIDMAQPGWHPSSAGKFLMKQETSVVCYRANLCSSCLDTICEGEMS